MKNPSKKIIMISLFVIGWVLTSSSMGLANTAIPFRSAADRATFILYVKAINPSDEGYIFEVLDAYRGPSSEYPLMIKGRGNFYSHPIANSKYLILLTQDWRPLPSALDKEGEISYSCGLVNIIPVKKGLVDRGLYDRGDGKIALEEVRNYLITTSPSI